MDEILSITRMWWGNEAHTVVGLIGSTQSGETREIGTPYDASSIVWDLINQYPIESIEAYTPPTEQHSNSALFEAISALSQEQKTQLLASLQ
jgi:hypothetical protein